MKGGSLGKTNDTKNEPIPVIVQDAALPCLLVMPIMDRGSSKGKDGCPERFSRDSDYIVLCRTLGNHLEDLIHLFGKHPALSWGSAHVYGGLE